MSVEKTELSIEEIQQKLAEPFGLNEVEWRVIRAFKAQSGKHYAFVAPYVEARSIQERFDNVLGIGNWGDEYKELHHGIICGITLHFSNEKSVVKWDGADLTQFEPTKGGLSSAFKRAAVKWGVGRYLYKIKEQMVEIFPDSKKGKIYFSDNKLEFKGSWNPPQLQNWALPNQSNQQGGQQQPPFNQNQSNQQPNNRSNQVKQTGEVSREELNESIFKMEKGIGIDQSADYVVRIFNKATNSQVEGVNLVRSASFQELKTYYLVLKPVYQLAIFQKKYNFVEEEFMKLVQTIAVESEITNLVSCFFNVTTEQVNNIKKLAKDTYAQRQAS